MLIDISNHQGAINWAVTAPAVDGAYIKITEGTHFIDPYWSGYHAGLTVSGKPVGAYHFADLGDPVAEANYFADQYLRASWGLRPVLDIESYGATAGWVNAFRSQFRARVPDPRFRVYTSMGFLQYALDPVGWMDSDTDIWMAHYSTTPGWDHPALVLWQNTSAAFVPGIVGNVDADQFMNGWTPAADIGGNMPTLDELRNGLVPPIVDAVVDAVKYRVLATDHKSFTFDDGRNLVDIMVQTRLDTTAANAKIAALDAKVSAIQGALAQEEADLLAAIKAAPTANVDPTALANALTTAGLPKAIATTLLAVLSKAATV